MAKQQQQAKVKEKTEEVKVASKTVSITPKQALDALDTLQAKLKIAPAQCSIEYWHPTGFFPLDLAINRGLPGGRIIEFAGEEGCDKTTLALHCIRKAQEAGGLGIYVDVEVGMTPGIAHDLAGVRTEREFFRLIKPENAEDGLYFVDRSFPVLARLAPRPVVVVVDSVAALVPMAELDVKYEDEAQLAGVARLLARFCRRNLLRLDHSPNVVLILINHVSEDFKANQYTPSHRRLKSSGGKAARYYPSVRLLFERGAQESQDGLDGFATRMDIKIMVRKNRVGPTGRTLRLPHNFVSDAFGRPLGLDDSSACVAFLLARKALVPQARSDGNNSGSYTFPGMEDVYKPMTIKQLEARFRNDDGFQSFMHTLVARVAREFWMVDIGKDENNQAPAEEIDLSHIPQLSAN